jgi:hypothetical protein
VVGRVGRHRLAGYAVRHTSLNLSCANLAAMSRNHSIFRHDVYNVRTLLECNCA